MIKAYMASEDTGDNVQNSEISRRKFQELLKKQTTFN